MSKVIKVHHYLNDLHDADLNDVTGFGLDAAKYGNVRLIKFPLAPYGVVSVVWEGSPNVSDRALVLELEKQMKIDGVDL